LPLAMNENDRLIAISCEEKAGRMNVFIHLAAWVPPMGHFSCFSRTDADSSDCSQKRLTL
jgi:hypothetical protein